MTQYAHTWLVLLADGTRMDIKGDACDIEYNGTLAFYKVIKTGAMLDEEVLLQALASGIWISATLRAEKAE